MLLPRVFLGCFPGILELSVTSAVQVSLRHCCISPTPFLSEHRSAVHLGT